MNEFWQAHQAIFDDKTACQSWWLTPHKDAPDLPKVAVCTQLNQQATSLAVSYFIEFSPKFSPLALCHFAKQADYLWQENCVECFVACQHTQGYFESNMAFDGRYCGYAFEGYRTPDIMPPRRASVEQFVVSPMSQSDIIANFYSRHVRLTTHEQISKIHPCVILFIEGEPVFYATQHANPPDFHNNKYWQTL